MRFQQGHGRPIRTDLGNVYGAEAGLRILLVGHWASQELGQLLRGDGHLIRTATEEEIGSPLLSDEVDVVIADMAVMETSWKKEQGRPQGRTTSKPPFIIAVHSGPETRWREFEDTRVDLHWTQDMGAAPLRCVLRRFLSILLS